MTQKPPISEASKSKLPAKWKKLAMARSADQGKRLTPARLQAYAVMLAHARPLSAYELLALLEEQEGRKMAPLTVYRHLEFLMDIGLVHRLESLQSYLTCSHPEHAHNSQYLVCTSCGHVDEMESQQMGNYLDQMAEAQGFRPDNAVVELAGLCKNCQTASG